MAAQLGKDLVVQVGGSVIAASRSCTFSMSRDSISTSSKDSVWEGREYGKKSASVSSDGLIDFSDTSGTFALDDALLNGNTVSLTWGDSSPDVGDDVTYSGTFLVTSFELSADDNSEGTVSVSFESTGAITETTA